MSRTEEWANGYARQAEADFETWEKLQSFDSCDESPIYPPWRSLLRQYASSDSVSFSRQVQPCNSEIPILFISCNYI